MGYRIRFIPFVILLCFNLLFSVDGDVGGSLSSYSSSLTPQSDNSQHFSAAGAAYAASSTSYQAQNPGYAAASAGYPARGYAAPSPAPGYENPHSGNPASLPAPGYGPESAYQAAPESGFAVPSGEYGLAQGYGTPAPSNEHGPPAQTYGPAPGYGPTTSTVKTTQKFNFLAVAAAFKFMMLWLLFILYKLVYFSSLPRRAKPQKPKETGLFCKDGEDERSIATVTDRFISQLLAGDFDVNKLFKGYVD